MSVETRRRFVGKVTVGRGMLKRGVFLHATRICTQAVIRILEVIYRQKCALILQHLTHLLGVEGITAARTIDVGPLASNATLRRPPGAPRLERVLRPLKFCSTGSCILRKAPRHICARAFYSPSLEALSLVLFFLSAPVLRQVGCRSSEIRGLTMVCSLACA